LREFEAEVAEKFGMEDAIFMPSGTMAQSIMLLINLKKEKMDAELLPRRAPLMRFACHHSSHLLLWEEESYSKLAGMNAVEMNTEKNNGNNEFRVPALSLRDVEICFDSQREKYSEEIAATESNTLGESGLSTLMIELPHRELGGKLPPWDDVISIGKLCKSENIRYHCDGARIFEASAGYKKNLAELAEPFDSMYVSFYKGLGSMSGAMLMGSKPFCEEARVWQSRFGGNLYSLMPYAISCWAGFRHHVSRTKSVAGYEYEGSTSPLSFDEKFEKLLRVTDTISKETEFNNIAAFDPPIPETNMVHVYLKGSVSDCEAIRDDIVGKYNIRVFSRIRDLSSSDKMAAHGYGAYFEWTMGEANGMIEDEDFVLAWDHFTSALRRSIEAEEPQD